MVVDSRVVDSLQAAGKDFVGSHLVVGSRPADSHLAVRTHLAADRHWAADSRLVVRVVQVD